jgi:hypothetical protein
MKAMLANQHLTECYRVVERFGYQGEQLRDPELLRLAREAGEAILRLSEHINKRWRVNVSGTR